MRSCIYLLYRTIIPINNLTVRNHLSHNKFIHNKETSFDRAVHNDLANIGCYYIVRPNKQRNHCNHLNLRKRIFKNNVTINNKKKIK